MEAAARHFRRDYGAGRYSPHPDAGHCHVRQVYAAGQGRGAGGTEQGLRSRRGGKRRAQEGDPVEKRPEIRHAHHSDPAGAVHRQLTRRHGHF